MKGHREFHVSRKHRERYITILQGKKGYCPAEEEEEEAVRMEGGMQGTPAQGSPAEDKRPLEDNLIAVR